MTRVLIQEREDSLILTYRDDSELIRSEQKFEDDREITRAVEYRLKTDPDNPRAVHRSVHVHLKQGLFGAGFAAAF